MFFDADLMVLGFDRRKLNLEARSTCLKGSQGQNPGPKPQKSVKFRQILLITQSENNFPYLPTKDPYLPHVVSGPSACAFCGNRMG